MSIVVLSVVSEGKMMAQDNRRLPRRGQQIQEVV